MHSKSIQNVNEGHGPIYKRDYWTVIRESSFSPTQIATLVARRFNEFSPDVLCSFEEGPRELRVGDQISLKIGMTSEHQVRVLHKNSNSLTLGTIHGHPEAGKITFGAYRNDRNDVVFHIRSCARSNSPLSYLGFLAAGEAVQTNTWTEFVNRVALTVGKGPMQMIHADTEKLEGQDAIAIENQANDQPTFIAQGD